MMEGKRAVGGLEGVAFVFHVLDLLDDPAALHVVVAQRKPELGRLVLDVALSREIRDEDPAVVADELGPDVLVGLGVLEHGVDVDAPLWAKALRPTKGLEFRVGDVGDLADEESDSRVRSFRPPSGRQGLFILSSRLAIMERDPLLPQRSPSSR